MGGFTENSVYYSETEQFKLLKQLDKMTDNIFDSGYESGRYDMIMDIANGLGISYKKCKQIIKAIIKKDQ